jgi:hypothetical protein
MFVKASKTSPIIASGWNVACETCDNVCFTQEETKSEALFQAKAWGWVRKGGKVICDVCKEVQAEKAVS